MGMHMYSKQSCTEEWIFTLRMCLSVTKGCCIPDDSFLCFLSLSIFIYFFCFINVTQLSQALFCIRLECYQSGLCFRENDIMPWFGERLAKNTLFFSILCVGLWNFKVHLTNLWTKHASLPVSIRSNHAPFTDGLGVLSEEWIIH